METDQELRETPIHRRDKADSDVPRSQRQAWWSRAATENLGHSTHLTEPLTGATVYRNTRLRTERNEKSAAANGGTRLKLTVSPQSLHTEEPATDHLPASHCAHLVAPCQSSTTPRSKWAKHSDEGWGDE